MAFDASVIRCLVRDFNTHLAGARIDKIHQPQKDALYITLRAKNGTHKLMISVNPACSMVSLTDEKYENPAAPPMFCMLLRKHLSGGKITDVRQTDFERIITFFIEGYDELGDLSEKKLRIEIMGKHSNIILLNQNDVIIDSVKRIDISTSSVRQVLPGLRYKFPPNERLNPLENAFDPRITESRDPIQALLSTYSGISPQLANEILNTGFDIVMQNIKTNAFSPCVLYQDGVPVDFAAVALSATEPNQTVRSVSTVSEAINLFYRTKAHTALLNRLSAELVHFIRNNIERCEKKLAIFKRQIQDAEKREVYRIKGELLTANLFRVQYGDTEITVDNYYDPNNEKIIIALDGNLSPAKNAQKYYTRYTKAKVSEEQAILQTQKTEKELQYLESVLDEILRAEEPADIAEIRDELRESGYLKAAAGAKKKKTAHSEPLKFEVDGYRILVGRNNRQNDLLTLKTARSQDIWLHTKNIPGSHVIIRKQEGQTIPDMVILKAAELAAKHSKAKNDSKVPVDYTLVKYVKKPAGAKPGMVIYDHYNTAYVTL